MITVDETNTSKNLSGDDQSMEHTVHQSKDRSSFRLRDIRLPDAIRKKVAKQYLTALLITLLTIWICIFYRNPSYVCGLAISGALIYLGISAKLDFAAGKFQELPVICVSSTDNLLRKTTHVVFRTNDEIPEGSEGSFSPILPISSISKRITRSSFSVIHSSDFIRNAKKVVDNVIPVMV